MLNTIDTKTSLFARFKGVLFFLAWLSIVTAAAGPRWIGEPIPLTREGRNIMMVLDLSGSMELNDMIWNDRPVTRLFVVKKAAEEFVNKREGDRLGLILFGTQAYLQTPLTFDRQNILQRLDDATVGLAGKTTSIGDAVGLAVKKLQDVPADSRVIILLTDGANNSGVLSPLKAAEIAKNDHIKIYSIGLGTDSEDLDEDTLIELAKMTGGHYFRATDLESLQSIYAAINQLEVTQQDTATIRPEKDYYPWFLAMALCLLLLAMIDPFNRRSTP